jgi:hypothetical protein
MAEKSTIAEFSELSEAERAVMVLDREGYVMEQVSIYAEGLDEGGDVDSAERFLVLVEGDAEGVRRAVKILEEAEAEAVDRV